MLREFIFGSTSKSADESPLPDFALTGNTGKRLTGRDAGIHLETYGGEDAIDWVMDCVDMYATTASSAKHYFAKPSGPSDAGASVKPEPVESPPQDLVNLLEHPNPYQDYTELMELAVIDLLVAGEFFWLKYKVGTDPDSDQFGKPLGLYRLSPALVDITFDDNDRPKKIVWTAPGTGDPVEFKPEHVVHVKRPNPHNQWRGMSIIRSSPGAMDIELAVVEAMRNYYENGTRPSGTLESDRTVPNSTWQKIKRQFRQLYSGSSAAGSVVMLEKGLKWTPMGADAGKAAYTDISDLSMKRIFKAFKVPLTIVGDSEGKDSKAVKEDQRNFDNKIMRPFLDRIQSQVTRQLISAWDLEWYIDHEYVMPIEDKLDLAQAFATLPGVTPKEIRGKVDLRPLEDNEDIPNGKEIDNMVLNLPGEETGHNQAGHADPGLGSEPGRPPLAVNTRAFPTKGAPLPTTAQVKKSLEVETSARNIRSTIRTAMQRLREAEVK